MSQTHEQLVAIFAEAKKAAEDADPGHNNDHGSCNADTAFIYPGRSSKKLIAAAAEAGIKLKPDHMHGRKTLDIYFPAYGQADRRTTMIRAGLKVLREKLDPVYKPSLLSLMD